MAKKTASASFRPPIVVVLGHVDHGKTTLLDTVRKTNVASLEHGGITQHIGAYQIETATHKKITFIDTPGHEAFAKMRSRGAAVADLAVLVVAADDSVKPQTKESIAQIKAANISCIVAVNKIDLPTANVDRVKSDLAKEGIQVEGFGGDVPIVSLSAKTGKGVPELLDMIGLVGEMKELKNEPQAPVEAVVIETRMDKGKGLVSSVIIKTGTLSAGSDLYEGKVNIAKVRAMFDEQGASVKEAGPSKPVEVLGFKTLPQVGAVLRAQPFESTSSQKSAPTLFKEPELPDFLKPLEEQAAQKLSLLLKADTTGSLEAIRAALDQRIAVVHSGIGPITDADILDAKASRAIVVGFNVKTSPSAEMLAQTEKVIHRTYTIIYELISELSEVANGLKEVITKERELGKGQIIAEFPFEKDRIAGTKVVAGRLARGDSVKIMRGEEIVGTAKIKSLRQGKNDVTKVEVGKECGVLLDRKVDFQKEDGIIAVTIG